MMFPEKEKSSYPGLKFIDTLKHYEYLNACRHPTMDKHNEELNMGILSKLFASKTADIKKSAAAAEQNLEKRLSKDLVEGVVSGSLLVSFADGTCDDDEITSLLSLLDAEESFAAWSSEIPALIERYSKKLRAGYKLGKMSALRELADLRSSPADAELCFACIETVADNGGVSDEERAVLKEIAGALGVSYRG